MHETFSKYHNKTIKQFNEIWSVCDAWIFLLLLFLFFYFFEGEEMGGGWWWSGVVCVCGGDGVSSDDSLPSIHLGGFLQILFGLSAALSET